MRPAGEVVTEAAGEPPAPISLRQNTSPGWSATLAAAMFGLAGGLELARYLAARHRRGTTLLRTGNQISLT
ncbi:hypothetical protein [Nocardia sp. BMG51109]|uniref:hypothetical protein n=1 Tax=Nocardia sp. BMG51109 TaxID=1056816 RepID=UPI001E530891|nr:hypothetical protein [Nocardia sp. BMG51109]